MRDRASQYIEERLQQNVKDVYAIADAAKRCERPARERGDR